MDDTSSPRGPQRLLSEWWCWGEHDDESDGGMAQGWGPTEGAERYCEDITERGDFEPRHRVIHVREAAQDDAGAWHGVGETVVVDVYVRVSCEAVGMIREVPRG